MADILKNAGAVKAAAEDLRAESATNWVAFGYEGEETVVSILSTGSGDLKSVESYFQPEQVVFVVLGYQQDIDGYKTRKHIFISWVGTQVKPLIKSRSSQHKVALYNFIKPHLQLHAEIQATTPEEITEKVIAEKLTGSRLAEASDNANQTGTPSKSGGQTKFTFSDSAAADATIKAVGQNKQMWTTFGYDNADQDVLSVKSSGDDYAQFESSLDDDEVRYALLGVATEEEGEYKTIKYILVTWVGARVKPLIKARSSQHRVQLYDYIKQQVPLGAEMQVLSREELSLPLLRAKLSGQRGQIAADQTATPERAKPTRNEPKPVASSGEIPNLSWTQGSEQAEQLLKSLRDSNSTTTWIVIGYPDESSRDLTLQGHGAGGLSDAAVHFKEQSVNYLVLAISLGQENFEQLKYVFVAWVGPRAKPSIKVLSSQHRVALYAWINKIVPLAGEVQMMSAEDVSEELIKKKLIGTKILTADEMGGNTLTKKAGPKATSEKLEFADKEQADALFKDVRSDSSKTNWLAFGYHEQSGDKLAVLGHGEGALDELNAHVRDDNIVYAVLGVVQEQGDYSQVKYIFISWVGTDVKPLLKARASQIRVLLYTYVKSFMQLAGELQASAGADLTEKNLASKLIGSRMVSDEEAKTTERVERVSKSGTEKFELEHESEVQNKIRAIATSDYAKSHQATWVVLGSRGSSALSVLGEGQGSLEELRVFFTADAVVYAVLGYAVVEQVEDSAVTYITNKHLFVSWVGPEVKPLAKARSSQQRVPLYDYANKLIPMHGQLHVERAEDLDDAAVLEKLTGARTQVESKVNAEALRLKQKEMQQLQAQPKSPRQNSPTGSALVWKNEQQAVEGIKEVRNDTAAADWIAFGYQGDSDDIVVLGTGTGGLNAVKSHFNPADVVYVVLGITEDEKTEGYATLKYIFITWVGPEVKPLAKARSSQHRVLLYNFANQFLQLGAEYQALSSEDVNEQVLRAKLKGLRLSSQ
eukprot:TRINITY_DN226_c0_g1_i2.p1 TRINITY_DN226_c0_g1~~TRINITY_DN226_c0_g1_i2.p1  ORF type:complete len:986 (-),score=464.10 TRINITY_DN226_c0_g1_i2:72-3029(-)